MRCDSIVKGENRMRMKMRTINKRGLLSFLLTLIRCVAAVGADGQRVGRYGGGLHVGGAEKSSGIYNVLLSGEGCRGY